MQKTSAIKNNACLAAVVPDNNHKQSNRKYTMEYFIAWWNLENLFDVANSTDRPEWLQQKLKSELAGWNNTVLNNKLKQLASIILSLLKP